MMSLHGIIPARFLSLTAHLVLNIMLYWSRSPNVEACIPSSADSSSSEYNAKDTQLLVALSLSLLLTVLELLGFLSGLSMFVALPSMFSTTAHVSAVVVLSLFSVNSWSCDDYWYILGFCSVPPLLLEIAVVIATVKFKVFS